jgi:hypothetical protein
VIPAASNADVCCTKGTPVRKTTSSLFRFITGRERVTAPDWWAYFGSFGDDIFGDATAETA